MVSREVVQKQLKAVGCNYRFWGRAELDELQHVLIDNETIAHCVNGQYENGFALLCATDHRVLLIDKKPMNFLNLQDVRFEMITEFDYNHRLFTAGVRICTPTKTLIFSSWNQSRLRALLSYVQQRVIEIRQYYHVSRQFQAMAIQQLHAATQTPPAFIPNMAGQMATGEQRPEQLPDITSTLGVFTQSKLLHFSRHSSRRLGRYAIPDEIYPPQLA